MFMIGTTLPDPMIVPPAMFRTLYELRPERLHEDLLLVEYPIHRESHPVIAAARNHHLDVVRHVALWLEGQVEHLVHVHEGQRATLELDGLVVLDHTDVCPCARAPPGRHRPPA